MCRVLQKRYVPLSKVLRLIRAYIDRRDQLLVNLLLPNPQRQLSPPENEIPPLLSTGEGDIIEVP